MRDGLAKDDWKAQYRELLRELEQKESAWQQVESVLRSAASRLGIAAMGRDEQLDRQLERIVEVVRAPGHEARLVDALEGLSRTVVDQERGTGGQATIDLARFVAGLPLPPDRQRHYQDQLGADEVDVSRDVFRALSADIEQLVAVRSDDEPALLVAAGQLLDRLDAMANDSATLRSVLERVRTGFGADAAARAAALAELADAVGIAVGDIEAQKTELERFLEQVTERLGDVEAYASATQADAEARRADTDALNDGVTSQMHGLRDDVSSANDVNSLKQRVGQKLDAISEQMRDFRERESRRAAAAESRNDALTEQINRMRVRTAELAKRCGDQEKRLMHDALTGVHTRYAYDQRLQEEFQRWQRHGQSLSYSIWDIDHFKSVNDTFGHQAGDRLLAAVAGLLSERTRTEDFVARLGGEEFVIVFVGTSIDAAHALAERLRAKVADTLFEYEQTPIKVTISCGLTEFRDGDTPTSVYERADAALYEAKNGGRNRSVRA